MHLMGMSEFEGLFCTNNTSGLRTKLACCFDVRKLTVFNEHCNCVFPVKFFPSCFLIVRSFDRASLLSPIPN